MLKNGGSMLSKSLYDLICQDLGDEQYILRLTYKRNPASLQGQEVEVRPSQGHHAAIGPSESVCTQSVGILASDL